MIRQTLAATKLATYSVDLPSEQLKGMPSPTGTGFFVSPDGWFVTAAHVVTENNESDGPVRQDVPKAWLKKELDFSLTSSPMCQHVSVELVIPALDFALLRVDWQQNSRKHHLEGRDGFHYLRVSRRPLSEGEPVYAFGYPLPDASLVVANESFVIAQASLCPRTTSAIVSSTLERAGMVQSPEDPKSYVLDKALNYGNSGGPIVAVETGHVHAFCSRFQPVTIRQPHLRDKGGNPLPIRIPSLYGVVVALDNPRILDALSSRGIPLAET